MTGDSGWRMPLQRPAVEQIVGEVRKQVPRLWGLQAEGTAGPGPGVGVCLTCVNAAGRTHVCGREASGRAVVGANREVAKGPGTPA